MIEDQIFRRFYGSRRSAVQVYELAKKCETVKGDFVECGIAMGSGIAIMKIACPDKTVWGYDSFQGIPMAGPKDTEQPGVGPIENGTGELVSSGITVHTRDQVNEILFQYLKFKEDDFILVEGWVEETLPKMKPKKIAFLRLDMDLYNPTFVALEHLWGKLSKGGVLLVDDGNLAGVVRACEDFFKSINYTPNWVHEGENPIYLVK
jgi:hypothetical protein